MIAATRLRRAERIAQSEHDRHMERVRHTQSMSPAEFEAAIRQLFQDAEACRTMGDLKGDVVRRAERVTEILGRAQQRKNQAESQWHQSG